MIETIDINDSRAIRNKNNVLGFYDLVINQKKSEEFVGKFISPAYIQHNPLIAIWPCWPKGITSWLLPCWGEARFE